METQLDRAAICIADAHAIAVGLAESLECMEGNLCADARYYALRACVDAIVAKSLEASEALDEHSRHSSIRTAE